MAGWPGAKNELTEAADRIGEGDWAETIEALRRIRFFGMLPFLGLFLLAPIVMLLARRRVDRTDPDWRFALVSLFFFAAGCLVWGLLLFGDQAPTVIHTSSLAVPLLGLCGCIAGLRAVAPKAAYWVAGISALLSLGLYAPSLQPEPGSHYSVLAAILAAAALVGFAVAAFAGRSSAAAAPAQT